jgi:hypothetical protein
MFAPYTPVDKCIGKEVTVRFGGDKYVGMLAGVYVTNGLSMMVLTPLSEAGTEIHIPLPGAVVVIRQA